MSASAKVSVSASASLSSTMFTQCVKLNFSEIIRSIVMKLHRSIHHGIVSATSMSLAGQGLSLTYVTRSVEHSQIYFYQLRSALFLRPTIFYKET